MRYKTLLIIITLILTWFSLSAQEIFWEDDFETNSGWNLNTNWSIQSSMLMFSYSPAQDNFDLEAVSPAINLPENVGDLEIEQWVSTYSPVDEVAEIALISGSDPTVLWSYEMINGDWGTNDGTKLTLSLRPFADSLVRLRFRCFGSSTWNLNNWNIYDLKIYSLFDQDISLIDIIGPSVLEVNEAENWTIHLKNSGLDMIDNYIVKFYHEDELLDSQDISEQLGPNEENDVYFSWTPQETGETFLKAIVILDGDGNHTDNISPPFNVTVLEAGSIQALLWDNDNDSHLTDPETGSTVGPQYSLEKTLQANNVFFQSVIQLPNYLSNFDVIFITLGLYCVG